MELILNKIGKGNSVLICLQRNFQIILTPIYRLKIISKSIQLNHSSNFVINLKIKNNNRQFNVFYFRY